MMISSRAAAASAAVAFVVSVVAGGTACAQTFHNKEGAIHFMYTPEYAEKIGRVPNQDTGSMEYFGGTVFSNVKVVSVMWGPNVNTQTVQGMPGFLKAMPNSTFQDQLAEYNTKGLMGVNGHRGSHQIIRRGNFFGQVVIKPHDKGTTLTNKQVHKELTYQISRGKLPVEDANTLYMIYFPQNITIEAFGLQSCSAFGAYHFMSEKRPSGTNIFYGVMPDCGYSFNSHTIISAHEFAEATSDNLPTPGTSPHYPQAWNTSDGYEIGDLCEGTQGQLTTKKNTYYVQQVYLNSTSACSNGNYTSP
jgi:hypothetical protein